MPKKKRKPQKPMQRWKLYQVAGNKLERKNKVCPKCSSHSFLAQHKDRLACGSCNYTEFLRK